MVARRVHHVAKVFASFFKKKRFLCFVSGCQGRFGGGHTCGGHHTALTPPTRSAGVVEPVDTPDLGSGGASRGGSSPSVRTTAMV